MSVDVKVTPDTLCALCGKPVGGGWFVISALHSVEGKLMAATTVTCHSVTCVFAHLAQCTTAFVGKYGLPR